MINQENNEKEEVFPREVRKITNRKTSDIVVIPKRWKGLMAFFKADSIEFRTFKDEKGDLYGEIRLLTKAQAEEAKKKEEEEK